MRVLVLHGGDSPEREVSFRSAKSVMLALKQLGVEYDSYDPKEGVDGLVNACKSCDLVLPILHGKNGEDGVVQSQLEQIGIRYLGASADVCRVTIDKIKTHKILKSNGIKMPKYEMVTAELFKASQLIKKPYVLKPIAGGSSVDIVIVREDMDNSYQRALGKFKKYDRMLLEELIDGVEVSAPVLGRTALPLIYIEPPEGEEFDYKNKYSGATKEVCPVPSGILDTSLQTEVQTIVMKAHKILNVRHLSRSEFIITSDGSIYMLELNTMPGLTDQSLFPKSALVAGDSMTDLVGKFISMVGEDT